MTAVMLKQFFWDYVFRLLRSLNLLRIIKQYFLYIVEYGCALFTPYGEIYRGNALVPPLGSIVSGGRGFGL